MSGYRKTNNTVWAGRTSDGQLYLHEKVQCNDLDTQTIQKGSKESFALLGYACGEGVKRNQGRIGAFDGPDAIRTQLAKMPNHLSTERQLIDVGNVQCLDGDLDKAQQSLFEKTTLLFEQNIFPILLGGGHDIAYPHYRAIKKHLKKDSSIGIVNFDAHFDLRNNSNGNNSGTPFYQIAQDCKEENSTFHYLCLGIRKDANDKMLFQTAKEFGVTYIENINFTMYEAENIVRVLLDFIRKVDHIYVTIDLDGFSSAYAPGVSAPSPMGFSPEMVLRSLKVIIESQKLISLDIAEMNPKYDIDHHTSKLAASLIHFVVHSIKLQTS